jgi:anthranilate synthase/aminodeoxychorismate synthase-like glutamine amidotransferase
MILIIDNYDSFTYNLYQFIAQLVTDVKVIRNNKITIEEIRQLSPAAIVLSPGPGIPENAGECINIIKNFSGEIPILGVCLGHQAIAVAFGASIIKSNQIVHGKTSVVFHNRGTLYKNIPLPFQAGRYHSLSVEKNSLPSQLKIEAETADQIIMGLRHVEHPTFGVQFHPESILSDFGMHMIENFILNCTLEAEVC